MNVVLAAHRQDHPDHATARPWLNQLLARREQFGVPWSVWWSFLRLSTNHRIFSIPTPADEAFRFVRAVRAQPGHLAVEPAGAHEQHLQKICASGEAAGDLVPDAVLAAIAFEHGGEVVSFDRDFARFPGLRWSSPVRPLTDASSGNPEPSAKTVSE